MILPPAYKAVLVALQKSTVKEGIEESYISSLAKVNAASIKGVLGGLEQHELVWMRLGDRSRPEEMNGATCRPKRFYRISDAGIAALA